MCLIERLVIRRVDVIDAREKACVHYVQVLVGKSKVQDDIGFERSDKPGKLGDIVRIDARCLNIFIVTVLEIGGDRLAFRFRPARHHDLLEDLGHLGTFVRCNRRDAARPPIIMIFPLFGLFITYLCQSDFLY